MAYQHLDINGNTIGLPVGKVVCIGQNYQDHIAEMQSKTAPEALFFIKPSTALCAMAPGFTIPSAQGAVHNETELAVLIGQPLKQAGYAAVNDAIWGYSLALDLTLRDIQAQLKQLGRPWEIAKGFDGACPVAGFVEKARVQHPQQLEFSLTVNGVQRQHGQQQGQQDRHAADPQHARGHVRGLLVIATAAQQHRHHQVVADHGGERHRGHDHHAGGRRKAAHEGGERQRGVVHGHGQGQHVGVGRHARGRTNQPAPAA